MLPYALDVLWSISNWKWRHRLAPWVIRIIGWWHLLSIGSGVDTIIIRRWPWMWGGCASITINLFSVTQTITTILLAVNTPLRRGGRKVERGNNRNRWRIFKATYEEFQVDMVYLLSFGTRRCLGCDMGIIGKILWQESYVKIAWVAIGLGMAK